MEIDQHVIQIIEMRRYMLFYLKQLVISSSGTQEEELQAILNYLHTVHEVNNKNFLFSNSKKLFFLRMKI